MENVPSGLMVQTVSLDTPPGQVTTPAHLPTTPAWPTDALCALTTGASVAPSSSANATMPTTFAPSNRVGLIGPSLLFRWIRVGPGDACRYGIDVRRIFWQERDSEGPSVLISHPSWAQRLPDGIEQVSARKGFPRNA